MLRYTITLTPIRFLAAVAPIATQLAPIKLIALSRGYRYFSYDANTSHLKYVPHAFSLSKATEIITEHDQHRLFAPFPKFSTNLTISTENPLKAAFVPICGINANIQSTYYEGRIGRDRTEIYTTINAQGKIEYSTRTVTDWSFTRGKMGSCHYRQNDSDMTIYFGEKFNSRIIEKAVECHAVQNRLQPFDVSQVSKEISVDPWKKVDAFGITEANRRIRKEEEFRAKQHIKNNNWWVDHVRIDHLSIHYSVLANGRKDFFLESMMLPIYTLEYPSYPARILSAISEMDTNVIGTAPVSDVKVMAATTTAATLISLLFPQVAVPARVLGVVTSAIASGIWAHFWPSIQNSLDEQHVNNQKIENARFSRSYIDDARLEATSRDEAIPPQLNQQQLDVDEGFYKILGLDPGQAITDEMIQHAVNKKLKSVHSDITGGDDEKTKQVIEARNVFRTALQKQNSTGKRYFSTFMGEKPKLTQRQVEILLKEPPRSSPHPNTGYLIKLVLEERKYDEALTLIKKGELHPDGHDSQENTLLTEAVKRKDVAGVKFALTQAKCSVDLSCDCPLHNTAMHYWAEGAGSNNSQDREAEDKIFKLLIQHKARVNLINSAGKTPLDMASAEFAKKQLIAHGAVRHVTQDGIAGFMSRMRGSFFFYSPSQRTKVIEQQIRNDNLLSSSSNESKQNKK